MKNTIYPTPQEAESAFYDALEKADLDAMMSVWADEDDIVCVHPGGPRLSGTAQIRESWRQIFSGGQSLRFRLHHLQSLSGVTLVVHSLYEQISMAGGANEKREPATAVATNIYLRTEQGWRMVAHHASPAPVPAAADDDNEPQTLH